MKLVEAVLEYIQGMSVVKAYGLDKDSGQAVQKNRGMKAVKRPWGWNTP